MPKTDNWSKENEGQPNGKQYKGNVSGTTSDKPSSGGLQKPFTLSGGK